MRLYIPSDSMIPDIGENVAGFVLAIFDSGIGGLAVMRALIQQNHQLPLLYLADHAHAPYGLRTSKEVGEIARGITAELIRRRAGTVVVACNTASAAALYELREKFQQSNIVGMEPAVRPASKQSRSGKIGVIATEVTLAGEPYAGVVSKYAHDLKVYTLSCPEFVELVESGEVDTPAAEKVVGDKLFPLLDKGIDQLVLGCTHYSFLKPLIEKVCTSQAAVIDPAVAVASQALRVWQNGISTKSATGQMIPRIVTTCPERLRTLEKTARCFIHPKAKAELAEWR